MDFQGRYVVRMALESAAPVHLTDLEVWRCDSCGKNFGEAGGGEMFELPEDSTLLSEKTS